MREPIFEKINIGYVKPKISYRPDARMWYLRVQTHPLSDGWHMTDLLIRFDSWDQALRHLIRLDQRGQVARGSVR